MATEESIPNTRCPKCGGLCTYNGNYYCLECSWALSCRTKKEREWAVNAYRNLMISRGAEPKADLLDPNSKQWSRF